VTAAEQRENFTMKDAPKSPVPKKTIIKWAFYSVAIVVLTVISIACHVMTGMQGMSSTFYLVAAIFGVIVCVVEVLGIYLIVPPIKDDDTDD